MSLGADVLLKPLDPHHPCLPLIRDLPLQGSCGLHAKSLTDDHAYQLQANSEGIYDVANLPEGVLSSSVLLLVGDSKMHCLGERDALLSKCLRNKTLTFHTKYYKQT